MSTSFARCWITLIVFLIVDGFNVQGAITTPFEKEFYNEMNCTVPQSRIAYLEDEYADYNSAAIYLPHAAIVQRCDNSIGCCTKDHFYTPTKEEKVTFTFHEFLNGNEVKREISLTNHLHCECQTRTHWF
ncbi:uncharacterized protein LOC130697877 [Daphnia carinata]|uniref:uncharacterized protein LOC130697877 n=1 Tax=Daphnia carinata TaxID=120202 RepID=UPI00257DF155|nr:uncharacterized protein LOC130697877 [Daphnia carinata]